MPVKRAVERRPHQLGHAGVDHDEVARRVARLDVDDAREQHAGRPAIARPGSIDDRQRRSRRTALDQRADVVGRATAPRRRRTRCRARRRGRRIRAEIACCSSSPPASAASAAARRSGSSEVICEPTWTWTATSFSDGRVVSVCEQLARVVERHAELVDLEAGRNVRMALGVDVRVDADRDARRRVPAARPIASSARQLAGRFDVDRLQPSGTARLELGHRLADAGEDDVCAARSRPCARPRFPRSSWRRPSCRARCSSRASASVEFAFSA